MFKRIKNQSVDNSPLFVWNQNITFSYIEKVNSEKKKMKWREKVFITATCDKEAKTLMETFIKRKKTEYHGKPKFKCYIHRDFQRLDRKPINNFPSIYSLIDKIFFQES